MRGYRYAMICADMQDMLGFCFDVRFFLVISDHVQRVQTGTDSSIKESDQERQQKAVEVEDLRKQLSKSAVEACLHWFALSLCGQHCMAKMEIDIVLGYRCGVICVAMQGMLGSFFCLFFPW